MFPPPEACKLIFIAVTLFGAHDVPLFLCPYLATSTAPTPPPALPCRYSSHPRRCPPAARGLRCTGLLRLGLRLYALPIPLACAHLLRTRVPSSRSSSCARGRCRRLGSLRRCRYASRVEVPQGLRLGCWVRVNRTSMTGSECARALRGAWCRVLASCNSGSAPRRGSGCIELRASAVNVNSIRCSLKRLKSST